ncbi:NAD(P)/FAD-dependent oxidoreductase [Sphingopyxis macrogoltabida]|uniref:FAD-dependent oxidoreductase n=1 Tax=Sphingopyxis macrogoltabida TaxID=33050 RepID=A0A0N9VEW7_SPHMC|nr:FAD-binding oxidoreductase [Sphingopyxis macrogoltabida]ALH82881.1 FAD-dependent oxidoreductase [Sphingopyxis macrogoltabida]
MTQRPATAIVIGNGVVGLASAIALQRRGVATTLVAPSGPWRGASWGNAGHIAVEQVEPLASPATLRSFPRRLFLSGGPVGLPPRAMATWLPFAHRLARASTPARFAHGKAALSAILADALPAWRRLLADAGAPALLREDGHVVVWESAASAAAGLAHWQAADTGTARFDSVPPHELAELQRLTRAPLAGAIRFAGSGQIADPAALGETLHARFRALGGRERRARAVGVAGTAGAKVTLDDGTTLTASLALVAAGAASAPLLKPLGYKVPLIAERGYHIESAATGWPVDMPPMVFEDRSMIVTRFAHGLRAASFVEFAREGDPPDPRKWARLRAHVTALGLDFGEPASEWIGARPTLPDYLPAIGRLAEQPAVAYAFGHQHLGLTLAAVTGEAVAALVDGEPAPIDLAPFDLGRFT